MNAPRVTVIVPVRNEEQRLGGCLDALAASDLPHEAVELLVVDGGSSDRTVAVARESLATGGWWDARVLHCREGDRSSNLNCGLAAASAPIVIRVDARSRIPAHYLRRCMELLEGRSDVAVVGGRQRAVAARATAVDIGVARALNNRWGMGFARYRSGGASGETETVYLGAYRTSQLRAADGWDTAFAVNEDFDLNRRLAQFGSVWFDAELVVDYLPRSSISGLLRQYWAFGVGKAMYWRRSGDRPRPRQILLLAAPLAGAASLAGVFAFTGLGGLAVALASGIGLATVIEVLGADGPPTGLRGHLAAVAALAVVAGSWLAGVVIGALRMPLAGASIWPAPLERAP